MTNFIEEPQQNSPSRSESDPEACDLHVDVYETPSDGSTTPSSTHTIRPEDGLVDNLSWDEDDLTTPTQHLDSYQFNTPVITPTSTPAERTPLIRKATSFNIPTTPRGYHSIEGKKTKTRTKPPRKIRPLQPTQKAREITAVKQYPPGRSTYGQTVSIKGNSLSGSFSTFPILSCSIRSPCCSASGCCQSPSPFLTPDGVAALSCLLCMAF